MGNTKSLEMAPFDNLTRVLIDILQ